MIGPADVRLCACMLPVHIHDVVLVRKHILMDMNVYRNPRLDSHTGRWIKLVLVRYKSAMSVICPYINTGVKQGCVTAPTLFSIFLAAFISLAAVDQAKGV